jgi:hypothetical protein
LAVRLEMLLLEAALMATCAFLFFLPILIKE